MAPNRRLDLQKKLLSIAPKAWYQKPPNNKMTYPCFVYKSIQPVQLYADNRVYLSRPGYEILYICQNESGWIWEKMNDVFGSCSIGAPYVIDNLYHYPFTLYY